MNNLSTSKWKEFRDFTVERLKNVTVNWKPYWHVYIQDTLHPELFECTKTFWPKEDWVPNNTGLNPNRKVNRAWKDYVKNMMVHTDIQQAVYNLEGLEYSGDKKCMDGLYEDTIGYAVGNHVDGHVIQMAWQIYVTGETGTNINDKNGNLIKELPFKENCSWIMRNDDSNFHSCDTVKVLSRRSIMARFTTPA